MRWACGKARVRHVFCAETFGIRIPRVSHFILENRGHCGPLWGREVQEPHTRMASRGAHTGFTCREVGVHAGRLSSCPAHMEGRFGELEKPGSLSDRSPLRHIFLVTHSVTWLRVITQFHFSARAYAVVTTSFSGKA